MRPTATAETAISFLCTPNNSLHRIVPMVKRLAAKGEVLLEHRGRTIYAFPSIGQVADLSEAELKEAKFGYRARTIPEIARQMIDRGGEEWLEDLKQKPYEQVHKELIELTGIGPKLADCIALFALDKTEAVPLDTHMWKMAVKHYFPQFEGKTVTGKRYQEVSEFFRDQFGELAGWAQQLLFYDSLTGGQATIDA